MNEREKKTVESLQDIVNDKELRKEIDKLRIEKNNLINEKDNLILEYNKTGEFYRNQKYRDENYISKDKIRKIVDECIEKKANVITGEEEYCFNTNDNSFLAHKIVELLEEK